MTRVRLTSRRTARRAPAICGWRCAAAQVPVFLHLGRLVTSTARVVVWTRGRNVRPRSSSRVCSLPAEAVDMDQRVNPPLHVPEVAAVPVPAEPAEKPGKLLTLITDSLRAADEWPPRADLAAGVG